MRIVSWNVAGLRACIRKGFHESMNELNPDIICLQEVKATKEQVDLNMPGYLSVWNSAKKAGYSGTLILSRLPILDSICGFGVEAHEDEGRSITVDLGDVYLVTSYTPNSQNGLARLPYRLEWERDFQRYLHVLDQNKPVILCGDLNVAHEEIDIARPNTNHESPGFSDEERAAMTSLLSSGFVDTYRILHPDTCDAYSYWSYLGRCRDRNVGWRLDYFIISERIMPCVQQSEILDSVVGSDHCPILLDIR